jgi:hypothetical protein
MTEVTPAAPAVPAAPAPVEPAAPPAPPWGEDFDPARAWQTIQNLREREKELEKAPKLTPEQQRKLDEYTRLEEASKSDAQRLQEAEASARRDADTARADSLRLRVAIEHGLAKEDIDLLGSGTQEEVTARAQRIAELRAAAVAAPPAPTPAPGQRPVEQLRPGATPVATQTEDDANYARLFGPNG